MRFGKAFRLSLTCWKLMLKTLVAQVLIIALIVSLCVLIFGNIVDSVVDAVRQIGLVEIIRSTAESIVNDTFSADVFAENVKKLINGVQGVAESMPNLFNRIEFAYVLMFVMLCVYRMMISSTDMAVYCSLNEFMTTNGRRPFTWYFFKKFGQSMLFVFLQFLLTFTLDLVVVFSAIGFFLLLLIPLGSWTVIPALIIAVILYSMRVTVTSYWMPAIVVENVGVCKGFSRGIVALTDNFWRLFVKNFLLILLMTAVTLTVNLLWRSRAAAIVTAVVDLAFYYLLKCVALVEYYEGKRKPYFYRKLAMFGLEEVEKHAKS